MKKAQRPIYISRLLVTNKNTRLLLSLANFRGKKDWMKLKFKNEKKKTQIQIDKYYCRQTSVKHQNKKSYEAKQNDSFWLINPNPKSHCLRTHFHSTVTKLHPNKSHRTENSARSFRFTLSFRFSFHFRLLVLKLRRMTNAVEWAIFRTVKLVLNGQLTATIIYILNFGIYKFILTQCVAHTHTFVFRWIVKCMQ